MGSWNLPFEVTVLIIMNVASVDISPQQRLQCVCKNFKDDSSFCENTSFCKFVFLSDILASILMPDHFVTASVSVSKIISDVGTHWL